jgi:hypothetical protein
VSAGQEIPIAVVDGNDEGVGRKRSAGRVVRGEILQRDRIVVAADVLALLLESSRIGAEAVIHEDSHAVPGQAPEACYDAQRMQRGLG